MIEIPDAKAIVESQLLEILDEVKHLIESGIDFKDTYEPPPDRDVSYSGEASVQLESFGFTYLSFNVFTQPSHQVP